MNHEGVTQDAAAKMAKAVQLLEESLLGIRAGAVSAGCVETVKVHHYGQPTPIRHLAQVHDDAGKVVVTPFDTALVPDVTKALASAGFNAYPASKASVAVAASPLSGGQRETVKAQIRKLGEDAKVAARGVRRQARNNVAALPEDARLKAETAIQNLTAQTEARIDQIVFFKVESLS